MNRKISALIKFLLQLFPMKFLAIAFLSMVSPVCFGLVVLQYHHVSDKTPSSTSVSPNLFEQHIRYLAENNFNVLTADEFADSLTFEKPLTDDKSVLITFDDGYDSVLTEAHKVLKTYNFPYIVFINPSKVGTKGYLSLKQLQQLEHNGATIANHTWNHPHLIREKHSETKAGWRLRITEEITKTQQFIETHFHSDTKLFAYPYGEFNQALTQLLEQLGFIGFSQHSGAIGHFDNRQALPRFAFGGNYGAMSDFRIKVNSLPLPVASVDIRDKSGNLLYEPLLTNGSSTPKATIRIQNNGSHPKNLQLSCFASGMGSIAVTKIDSVTFETQSPKPFPIGRNRYNCTAASKLAGRFYWLSLPFYKKNDNGSWYPEY